MSRYLYLCIPNEACAESVWTLNQPTPQQMELWLAEGWEVYRITLDIMFPAVERLIDNTPLWGGVEKSPL